jgi:hypothetical protein
MNEFQIIDPKSLSFNSILTDLQNYIQNLPDSERWKDFFISGAGTTQTELLAGLGAFLSFHSLGARRESYLDSCKLYTSAINICNIIGYPVNRVSAPRLKIKFYLPLSTFWDRETPLFYFRGKSISLLNSQTISGGTNEIECVVGDWKNSTFVSTTNEKFANTLILDTGIDTNLYGDTLEVYINGVPKTLIKYADEFLPDNVLIKTYSGGVLLVFGDGVIGYQLRVNDNVIFNYINTDGVLGVNNIQPSELTKNLDCRIENVQILNPGYHEDSIPKLAATAPGYLTSKRRMVTGTDHVYIFLNYAGSLISANFKKDTEGCCTMLLSYLFSDEHLATNAEKQAMFEYLDQYKMIGEQIILVDPKLIGIEMKMVCIVEEGIGQTDIENQITETVSKYTMKLGNTFHIGQVTSEVSRLNGVFRVYLVRPVSDHQLEYDKYLKLVSLEVIVTANKDYVVDIDPSNNGYWKYLSSSNITGLSDFRLINGNASFTMLPIQVGSLIVNPILNLSAHLVEIISDTEIRLDKTIFTEVGQKYEIFNVNV